MKLKLTRWVRTKVDMVCKYKYLYQSEDVFILFLYDIGYYLVIYDCSVIDVITVG
jgi:hypothetical protein